MARPKKAKAAPPAVCEALLLATVCMVGLPVEVQVRDGSAYAGVFHTASLDAGYGVVLKKARKIANGKDNANMSLGAFVDTLVVLPDDLVQVIAKDFSFATKDSAKTTACGVMAASLEPQTSHLEDPKASRQVEKCNSRCHNSDISIEKIAPRINSSSSEVKTSQPVNNFSTNAVMSSKSTTKITRNWVHKESKLEYSASRSTSVWPDGGVPLLSLAWDGVPPFSVNWEDRCAYNNIV